MTVAILEKYQSGRQSRGDSNSLTVEYVITGTDDAIVAREALDSGAAPILDGLLLVGTAIESRLANEAWSGTATYGLVPKPDSTNTPNGEYSFETGGGTAHITQSLGTTRYALAGSPAPDYKGTIGARPDGSVDGVDVVIPNFEWSETWYYTSIGIPQALGLNLLTGRINQSTFKGFPAGSVLFRGASGGQSGNNPVAITYRFAYSVPLINATINGITGINKRGWDYIWVLYEDYADATARKLVQRARAVYVEKVYPEADFSVLGIG